MTRIIATISFIFFQNVCVLAQAPPETALFIPGQFSSFAVDNLENIYLITITNQLKKLNERGDSIAVYNDVKKFGEATMIDVSNPLKILVYYKEFNTVLMLDRFLNPVNTIDLRKKNIFKAAAIALSYDGKIWVYDELDNALKKMDDDGRILFKTPDFRQLYREVPVPQQIIDKNSYVYLYDSACCIYTFDYYGAQKNKIPISQWSNLHITDKYIFGNDTERFYKYNITTLQYQENLIPSSLSGKKQYLFTNRYLYVLDNNGLSKYAYKMDD